MQSPFPVIGLSDSDVQFVKTYTEAGTLDGAYARKAQNLFQGDLFELAFATWVGEDARKSVVDRLLKHRKFVKEYDFVSGPHEKRTDTKCASSHQQLVNLIVTNRSPRVAYVQGKILVSIAEIILGSSPTFELRGWRHGSDADVFVPCDFGYGPRFAVDPDDLFDMESYRQWLLDK